MDGTKSAIAMVLLNDGEAREHTSNTSQWRIYEFDASLNSINTFSWPAVSHADWMQGEGQSSIVL